MPALRRPRVLLAIEPRLLEGAVGDLLEQADGYDVTQFHAGSAALAPFDVAVVSIELPAELRPDVVIHLPPEGRAGRVRVERSGTSSTIDVRSLEEILDLLALESGAGAHAVAPPAAP